MNLDVEWMNECKQESIFASPDGRSDQKWDQDSTWNPHHPLSPSSVYQFKQVLQHGFCVSPKISDVEI